MSAVQVAGARSLAPVPRTDEHRGAAGEAVTVQVWSPDPVLRAGVVSQLRVRPEVRVVVEGAGPTARVVVVVTDVVDDETLRDLRRLARQVDRLLLVAAMLDDGAVVRAAEAGVSGLLRRSEGTSDALVHAIQRVATGNGELPPDLLGRLLQQVGRLQRQVLAPRGLTFSGLTPREIQVLTLCADGCDTAEIATALCYSERTVKNVLHDLNTRLHLRNRTHAVAYALREGLI